MVIPAQFQRGTSFYDFPACYYRFHLEAPVRFSSSIRCGIEHGGVNDTDSKYASLAYYYIQDRVGLAQTDAVAFSGTGGSSRRRTPSSSPDRAWSRWRTSSKATTTTCR